PPAANPPSAPAVNRSTPSTNATRSGSPETAISNNNEMLNAPAFIHDYADSRTLFRIRYIVIGLVVSTSTRTRPRGLHVATCRKERNEQHARDRHHRRRPSSV